MCNKLSEKIINLKKLLNGMVISKLLDYIEVNFIKKMELDTESGDSTFENYISQMNTLVDKCLQKIEDYGAFIELKNIYSEALMLSKLKLVLYVEKIPESNIKSPDFKSCFNKEPIYIEVKSLNMVDGDFKHKTIMEESLDKNIELEKELSIAKHQAKDGQMVFASVQQIINPYSKVDKLPSKSNSFEFESSRKLVIETLISKITQNLKEKQFSYDNGNTILLVDLSGQLSLFNTPTKSMEQVYIDELSDPSRMIDYINHNNLSIDDLIKFKKSIESSQYIDRYVYEASGCLWHVAFGQPNMELIPLKEDNTREILDKQGILEEFNYIKGLLFHIDGKFYSLMKTIEPLCVYNLLNYLYEIKFIEKHMTKEN